MCNICLTFVLFYPAVITRTLNIVSIGITRELRDILILNVQNKNYKHDVPTYYYYYYYLSTSRYLDLLGITFYNFKLLIYCLI